MADKVRLLDAFGEFIHEIGSDEAHRLIRERKATGMGTRKRIRAVQLTVERKAAEDNGVPGREPLPNGLVGQRYSHNHESDDNVEQNWTLRKLTAASVNANVFIHECFVASVISCLPEGEKRAEFRAYLRSLHAKKISGRVVSDLS